MHQEGWVGCRGSGPCAQSCGLKRKRPANQTTYTPSHPPACLPTHLPGCHHCLPTHPAACSPACLRGGEERLTFSVLWEMSPDANILSTAFTKALIRSRAALTYADAQVRLLRAGWGGGGSHTGQCDTQQPGARPFTCPSKGVVRQGGE
ncbi:MAG: RNB domain-containing ribonuclease [Agrobacterium sp.]|uniref:RNB domain-containing ribonuclease n=1 Tax=Agrobacterium sp. TaxID=361 RepID=UPI004034C74D